jgi:hypothetical protein
MAIVLLRDLTNVNLSSNQTLYDSYLKNNDYVSLLDLWNELEDCHTNLQLQRSLNEGKVSMHLYASPFSSTHLGSEQRVESNEPCILLEAKNVLIFLKAFQDDSPNFKLDDYPHPNGLGWMAQSSLWKLFPFIKNRNYEHYEALEALPGEREWGSIFPYDLLPGITERVLPLHHGFPLESPPQLHLLHFGAFT